MTFRCRSLNINFHSIRKGLHYFRLWGALEWQSIHGAFYIQQYFTASIHFYSWRKPQMMEPFLHGGCSANIPHWGMIPLPTVLLDCIVFYTFGTLPASAVSSFLHVGPKIGEKLVHCTRHGIAAECWWKGDSGAINRRLFPSPRHTPHLISLRIIKDVSGHG